MSAALSTDIVTRIRNYFPDVSIQPLYSADMKETNHRGLFRMDNGECFGPAVGPNYVPHTTEDVCAIVEASEPVLGECGDVQLGFHTGHYVSIQPTKEHLIKVHQNDDVFPRLIIRARYGQAFRASIGLFRVACSNLSMFSQVAGTSVTLRHTSSLRSRMNDLIEDFNSLKDGVGNLETAIKEMADRKVRLADFLDAIYGTPSEGASQRAITAHRNRTESIVRRIQREQVALGYDTNLNEVSAWLAYQGVQGYIQHDARRRGKPGDFDRAILAMADPKVAEAQHLALSMSV